MFAVKEEKNNLVFRVFVLPRSSKNQIVGVYEDTLKLKLTAPPVDGAANKLCVQYLSKVLKIPKSSIEVVSGHTGRRKTIALHFSEAQQKSGIQKSVREYLQSFLN